MHKKIRGVSEADLLGQIELLHQRVEELELQVESIRVSGQFAAIKPLANSSRDSRAWSVTQFIRAAFIPLISGVFRAVYKVAYRKKK